MPTDTNPNDFIDVSEAARIAGRSHWAIRRWLQPGPDAKLTRYKSLNRTVVSRSELMELVRPRIEATNELRKV